MLKSAADVTDKWYKEHEKYVHTNPGYSAATGHFTQVIIKIHYPSLGFSRKKDYTPPLCWVNKLFWIFYGFSFDLTMNPPP